MATSRRAGTNEQIKTYGTGKDYTEGQLATWEQATDTNHVADAETDVLEVYKEGSGGGLWDDYDVLDGSTNNASYFRIIRPASGEGHSGIPKDDGTVAGFRYSGAGQIVLSILETYSQIQDIVLKATNNDTSDRVVLDVRANEAKAIGCLVYDSVNNGSGGIIGIRTRAGAGNTGYAINCLVHNVTNYAFYVYDGTGTFYNCTENSCATSIRILSGTTANTKNCILDDTITNNGTHNQTTNVTGTPTYVDSANDDFHLDSSDTVAKDQGTDLSADGNFAFDDDINDGVMGAGKAGETRSGTWDVGFDEYIAPPTTLPPTTLAPTTLAPTTAAPTTLPPTTLAPTTLAPTTLAPTTLPPTTLPPTTTAPTTLAPTTLAPTTLEPTTPSPTTLAPTTVAPTTIAPTTIEPTTLPPTTIAPTTVAPTTLLQTTLAPTTIITTTLAPTTPSPFAARRRGIKDFGFSFRDRWRN